MWLFNLADRTDEDYSAHNEACASLWEAFRMRRHTRVPIRLNTNPRVLMLDPHYNVRGVSYETYMQDPEIMGRAHLEWQYWTRFYLPGDHEKGLPEEWTVGVDFENFYDASWLGCPVQYRADQVPDTTPILTDDRKRMLFDRGIPDPFGGEWAERCLRFIDHFDKKSAGGWTFLDRPVKPPSYAPFAGCDGVFTVAASLRGATELCADLFEDPEYVHELLAYINEALVTRIQAWRRRLGIPDKTDGFWYADDSIELISVQAYVEFILPIHKRCFDALATQRDRMIHLCGDAQRHFVAIRDELGVTGFDTGFPIDFARLRRELGPDILVSGGPSVPFFLHNDVSPIIAETTRVLHSGILEGGRFILQEGNNLPPRSRLEACRAFYETGVREGVLSGWA